MFLLFGNLRYLLGRLQVFFFLTFSTTLTAQQKQPGIHHLLKQLETAREDTNKANLLNKIASSCMTDFMEFPRSMQYYNPAFL